MRLALALGAVLLGVMAGRPSPAQEQLPEAEAEEARLERFVLPEDIGAGTLLRIGDGIGQPLPLLDFQVGIEITGVMVHGTVRQSFRNPTAGTIEALYVFPLPEQAAVHHMEIRVGERRIVSAIQEREEAVRTFQAARREGKKAALLEQQRPNLFRTRVTSINGGETIDVVIEFLQELRFADGSFHLDFPLAYTPRFGAGEAGDDDEERLALAPPPATSLMVRVRGGVPLEEPVCASHAITWSWDNEVLVITPEPGRPLLANRDFTLRLTPQVGYRPEAAVVTEDTDAGRYALLMILPPAEGLDESMLATETLFIIDVSSSMSGPSIEQARTALLAALDRLHRDDTFNILAFNDGVAAFAEDYVVAREEELGRARHWVRGLQATGGTRIDLALAAGLDLVARDETWRVERMIFMTDGAISFEDAVLDGLSSRLGPVRLHTLGIGAAPNRYLMRKLADAGRGLVAFIARVDAAENHIDRFLSRLARPVMTDITLHWEGDQPLDTYPVRLPDLHAGEPLVLSARFPPGTSAASVVMEGRIDSGTFQREVVFQDSAQEATGIAVRWARHKVGQLMDGLHEGADADTTRQAVIEVSRQYGIVTRYTSLVAVEEFPTADGDPRRVKVASAAPGQGQLPLGGTMEPLHRRIMLLCGLGAVLLSLAARLRPRQSPGSAR